VTKSDCKFTQFAFCNKIGGHSSILLAVDRDTKGTNKQLHVMHWQMNINSRRGKYEPERKYVRKTPFAQKNIL
jgi:hypothetical protein